VFNPVGKNPFGVGPNSISSSGKLGAVDLGIPDGRSDVPRGTWQCRRVVGKSLVTS
jgi:hypothetical protein